MKLKDLDGPEHVQTSQNSDKKKKAKMHEI